MGKGVDVYDRETRSNQHDEPTNYSDSDSSVGYNSDKDSSIYTSPSDAIASQGYGAFFYYGNAVLN